MRIKLSGNLLRFSNFRDQIQVEAPSVAGGIQKLVEENPNLKNVLLDGNGGFRAIHRVFLNGELLAREELDRSARAEDEVSILTAIAGG